MGAIEGLEVELLCADVAQGQALVEWAERVVPALQGYAQMAGVPDLRVRLVLADDFAGEVTSRLGLPPGAEYTTERLGGTAVGKNLNLPGDPEFDVIVLDAEVLRFDDAGTSALSLYLVVHEVAHSIFRRLRRRTVESDGAAEAYPGPHHLARTIVRVAVEEYRCDRLAAGLLEVGGWFSATDESGTIRAWRTSDSLGGAVHRLQVADVLSEHVHPGWPATVSAYRDHRLALDDLWAALLVGTDQLMTLLGHAEAEAHSLQLPGPLAAECADHPGTRLYAGEAWTSIMAVVDEQDLVPALHEFATRERELLDAGEAAVFTLWRALGVRPSLQPTGDLYIAVDDPQR